MLVLPLPTSHRPASGPPLRPEAVAQLTAYLATPGVTLIQPPEGVLHSTSTLWNLLQDASSQAAPVIRLRAEHELARQCSLLSVVRSLGFPEQHVRSCEHPQMGLLRYLAEQPDAIVWIDGLTEFSLVEDLLPRLREQRVVVSGLSQEFARRWLPQAPSIAVDLLTSDAGRQWLSERLGATNGSSAMLPQLPAAWLRSSGLLPALNVDLVLRGTMELVVNDVATPQTLLRTLASAIWNQLGDQPLAHWLALWTCVDREMHSRELLQAAWKEHNRGGQDADDSDSLLTRAEQLGLVTAGPFAGGISLESNLHAALAAVAPPPLRHSAGQAWRDFLAQSTSENRPAESIALHVDRLVALAKSDSPMPPADAESTLQLAAGLCRAVGAWTTGIHYAQEHVKRVVRRAAGVATPIAAAWMELAEQQRSGQQLLAARHSARAAEEALSTAAPQLQHRLPQVKCFIAEIDLAEGRAERAFHRLEAIRPLLQEAPRDRLVWAHWLFLRGACLLAGKQPERSIEVLRESLELRTAALTEDHELLLAHRSLLARNLFACQRWSEAEALLQEDLRIRRTSPRTTPAETAVAANLLADLYFAAGKYAAAEPLLEEVLQVRRQTLDSNDRLIAEAAARLATLKSSRGDYPAADQLFRLALSITENIFGESHPRVAEILNELAKMLFTQSRHDQSRRLLERALSIQLQSLRKSDPRIAETRNNLAAVYVARSHYDHAARMYADSLAVLQSQPKPALPILATTLNNLGDVYRSLGRYGEAERLLEQALTLRRQLLGESHPVVAQSLSNLGYLKLLMGKTAEARQHVEQALAIRRATLGPAHPHTANSLMTLGRLARRAGDDAAALAAFEAAAEMHRQALGDKHQLYGANLAALGRAELVAGRHAKAELHLLKARFILEDTVGSNHRLYADALLGLAELYESEGRTSDAFPLLERALAIQKQTLGPDRYETAETLLAIGGNLLQRGVATVAFERLNDADQLLSALIEPPGRLVLQVCELMARAALAMGHVDAAETQVGRGLKLLAANPEPDADFELRTIQAEVIAAQRRYPEAESLFRQLLADAESRAGGRPESLVPMLDQLAATLLLQDRPAEAEPVVRRSLELTEQQHGRRHESTLTRIDQLASVLLQLNQLPEARRLLDEVIGEYEGLSNSDPEPMIEVLRKQAHVLQRLNLNDEASRLEQRATSFQGRATHVLDDIL